MTDINDINDLFTTSANFDKDFEYLKQNAKEVSLESDDDWNEDDIHHHPYRGSDVMMKGTATAARHRWLVSSLTISNQGNEVQHDSI